MNSRIKTQWLLVFTAVLTLFVGLMTCPDVYAASKTKAPPAPKNPWDNKDDSITVDAVDATNQQVTLLLHASSQKVVYTVDLGTKITVQGNAATLSQVHAGLQVYSYVERDNKTLDSLEVGPVRPKAP